MVKRPRCEQESVEEIVYESGLNNDKPIVLVDSEAYSADGWCDDSERGGGEYHYSKDKHFSNSTGRKNLDLEVIMQKLESYLEGKVYRPKDVISEYFIPTQDKNELINRQEVVKELYENRDKLNLVSNIITSTKKLKNWREEYGVSMKQFGQRTDQVRYLVNIVENALKLNPKSNRLRNVKKFAQTIAKRPEYKELKSYISTCASKVFEQYAVPMTQLKKIWDLDRKEPFTTSELLDLHVKVLKDKKYARKIDLLEFDTRRNIYSALLNLKDVFDKLMNDKNLEYILDKKEASVFKLEERLNKSIEILGDFATIDYKEKHKITAAEQFFSTKFAELLYHINKIIDQGLERRMNSLDVKTSDLGKELSFYYSMAMLAHDMERISPITLPEALEKEKRYCKITQGNVPSFVIRAVRDRNYDLEEDDPDEDNTDMKKPKFVANDVYSNQSKRVFVITGANDNGKTTYERFIGQSQVLFQLGSFIPAPHARMSIVDGIFTSFSTKDKPNQKEGNFLSGLNYLHYISVPQRKDSWHSGGRRHPLEIDEIQTRYFHCDNSFMTKYSLVLLDEIAIGSDSEATKKAIERTLNAGILSGARMYLSTHYHPIAERVEKGEFKNITNLGAIMDYGKGKPKVTYKIKADRHEPSMGERLFEQIGFTEKAIKEGQKKIIEAKLF
ncbi:MAG: hypothetical protein Q8O89_08960 [Nanoarchaeota archaeon]|nr:hypothetical protein [Nanoarchaeota archaeon]